MHAARAAAAASQPAAAASQPAAAVATMMALAFTLLVTAANLPPGCHMVAEDTTMLVICDTYNR